MIYKYNNMNLSEKLKELNISLKAIESVVQLVHSEDWEYGNNKKRCEELLEQTRNKIGYSKKDL